MLDFKILAKFTYRKSILMPLVPCIVSGRVPTSTTECFLPKLVKG